MLKNILSKNPKWESANFTHNLVELKQLETIEGENGRFYKTPQGELYPSITTVLGVQDNTSLLEWKNRVGIEEAERVSKRATNRGNRVHKLFEDYLNNKQSQIDMFDLEAFSKGSKILKQHVNNVRVQEGGLYSHYLKCGGRVDLIANFDGKLSIIDFKTSTRHKEKKYIENYFLQTAAYAVMFEELTKLPVSQLVILIMVDHDDPQIFIEKRDNWINKFIEVRNLYKLKYNI